MSVEKTIQRLLRAESDANIRFDELCHLLQAKGFRLRASGSHHIFTQPGVVERINLQRGGLQGQAVSGAPSAPDTSPIQTAMKNPNYEMIIWWSQEDEAFVVDVPELPGCMAHGATRVAALRHAEEAIAFWIQTAKEDGLPIPEPKGRLVYA